MQLEGRVLVGWACVAWGRLLGRARGALAEAVAARDTAQIDLNIALAKITRKEAELSEQIASLTAQLEAEQHKSLHTEKTTKENERLRGKLEASKRLAQELHGQVASERAREHLMPLPEHAAAAQACTAGGSASALTPLPLLPSPADTEGGGGGAAAAIGALGGHARLDWMLASRERDLERVRFLSLSLWLSPPLSRCLALPSPLASC